SFKFRVPPLSNRTWMAPEAAIVDIRYEIDSSNPVLAAIESVFNVLGHSSFACRRFPIAPGWHRRQPSSTFAMKSTRQTL
ncbi:hypothetical protein, partial [Enterobacter hormaechei]|uniref:hypothetical protein n=1 Tax=Enterobacter hormaechei TaxID=158836 RepID=UPI00197ACF47